MTQHYSSLLYSRVKEKLTERRKQNKKKIVSALLLGSAMCQYPLVYIYES